MDIKDVEALASLARIEMSAEEKQEILKDMGGILDYVKQIQEVEIPDQDKSKDNFEHTNHNVWREDKVESRDFSKDLILEQFPNSQDGFLKVKKIL